MGVRPHYEQVTLLIIKGNFTRRGGTQVKMQMQIPLSLSLSLSINLLMFLFAARRVQRVVAALSVFIANLCVLSTQSSKISIPGVNAACRPT
jgi:hypothetical protein